MQTHWEVGCCYSALLWPDTGQKRGLNHPGECDFGAVGTGEGAGLVSVLALHGQKKPRPAINWG